MPHPEAKISAVSYSSVSNCGIGLEKWTNIIAHQTPIRNHRLRRVDWSFSVTNHWPRLRSHLRSWVPQAEGWVRATLRRSPLRDTFCNIVWGWWQQKYDVSWHKTTCRHSQTHAPISLNWVLRRLVSTPQKERFFPMIAKYCSYIYIYRRNQP